MRVEDEFEHGVARWGRQRLLERDAELAALRSALRDAAVLRRGRVLLVRGPAGIGRSGLLAAFRQEGEAAGALVAAVGGVPTRATVGHGSVRELLGALAARGARPPRGARAASAWRVVAEAGAAAPSVMLGEGAQVIARGLSDYLLELAAERPTLLVVDDLQWVDEPSRRTLALLAQRLADQPLVLVAAVRTGDGDPVAAPAALLGDPADAQLLELRPLSERATAAIVAGALRDPGIERLGRQCHELTGGNPFLTVEVVAELRTRWREGAAAGLALLEGGLDRFVDHLLARAEAVGPDATAVAEAVAVLGPGARIDDLAALAGRPVEAVATDLDGLTEVGLLSEDDAGFHHPILRSALYEAIGLRRRQQLHEEAARRFADRAAPASDVATHVLAARPGRLPWAREALVRAGQEDLLAGAPETAVRYLRRALAEDAAPAEDAVVHALLALAHWQTGDPVAAADAIDRAVADAPDDETRLRWAIERNTMMTSHADTIDAAFAAFAAVHEQVAGRVSASAALAADACLLANELLFRPTAVTAAVDRHRTLEGREDGEQQMLSILAWRAFVAGEPRDEVVSLARRGLAHGTVAIEAFLLRNAGYYASFALLLAEDRPFVSDALAGWERTARDLHALFGTAGLLMLRAYDALAVGEHPAAAERAAEALDLTGAHASLGFMALSCRIRALIELDRVDDARAELERAGVAFPLPATALTNPLLHARGLLERAAGDDDAAAATFRAVGEADARAGMAFSPATPWRLEAARIAHDRDDAATARTLAAAHRDHARRWGAPGALAVAEATARLVGLEQDDPAPVADGYVQATVEQLLGQAVLGAGDQPAARRWLRSALDRLDPDRHPRRARLVDEALRDAGGRRSAREDDPLGLTPAERRIAELVAEGLSNRQVADALVLQPKSVENQLGRIYRRLGVRSRQELVRALRRAGGG
ncbi:ATP-binding protein [Patulibacter defluvii]|uniref:ATP-binding protein n=1 Tax=Patulibacter defluvii TaxID=3095358 RepID=UPI002A74EE13|nr:AAA family ATPase [Patulibacter sp. DM4]